MAKLEEDEEEGEEGEEEDEFVTASNTMIQKGYSDDSLVINEVTMSDLGTLVIMDDDEEVSDTMKRETTPPYLLTMPTLIIILQF